MSGFDDGGPAFPITAPFKTDGVKCTPEILGALDKASGLTVWDWYAAAALQGLLSGGFKSFRSDITASKEVTFFAAQKADLMLVERRKRFEGDS